MMYGLNFNRSLFILILPFVSFLATQSAWSQTSGKGKDEFELFEEEIKGAPAKPTQEPSQTPTAPSTPTATTAPAPSTAAPVAEGIEEKIERLKKEIRANPKNAAKIVDLAEVFYKKADYEKSTLLLWKHVDKIDRSGLILLAKAHEQRNEPSEMIRALNIIVAKDTHDAEAQTLMGNAYSLQKKNKEAMEAYKKAVEINPKYEPGYNGLINLYEKRDPPNLYELRILFQDMIDTIGPRPQFLLKLCEINVMDGTYEAALPICKDAIIKNPKIADPYVYMALCYRSTGDDEKSIQTLKKAAMDFPKSELAQYSYAKVLEEQKNYVEAMNRYKSGTEANPKSARSWLGLATSSFEIRKYEVAYIAYKNACKYDKKNAAAFRKATATLKNQRNSEWSGKFESSSENCTF